MLIFLEQRFISRVHNLLRWDSTGGLQPSNKSATTFSRSCPKITGPSFTWKLGTPHTPSSNALVLQNFVNLITFNARTCCLRRNCGWIIGWLKVGAMAREKGEEICTHIIPYNYLRLLNIQWRFQDTNYAEKGQVPN